MRWYDACVAMFCAFCLGFGTARLLSAPPMPSGMFNGVWLVVGLIVAAWSMASALKRSA